MLEALLELVHQAMNSPWLYAVVAGMAALDMFLPVIPGETAVVTAGVAAATGQPHLVLVIAAAALGASTGDHIAYTIGRSVGGPLTRRLQGRHSGRWGRALAWAQRQLTLRGAQVLIASRCVPGVRTATTITMGVIGYRLRSFTRVDAIAAPLWATGCALVGYTGGVIFPTHPLLGLLAGLALATAITLLAELVHRRRAHHSTAHPNE